MNKANSEIRSLAKKAGVTLDELAEFLKVEPAVFAKWLRKGLPANVKPRIIERLKSKLDESEA